jgi:hypothetical protein
MPPFRVNPARAAWLQFHMPADKQRTFLNEKDRKVDRAPGAATGSLFPLEPTKY